MVVASHCGCLARTTDIFCISGSGLRRGIAVRLILRRGSFIPCDVFSILTSCLAGSGISGRIFTSPSGNWSGTVPCCSLGTRRPSWHACNFLLFMTVLALGMWAYVLSAASICRTGFCFRRRYAARSYLWQASRRSLAVCIVRCSWTAFLISTRTDPCCNFTRILSSGAIATFFPSQSVRHFRRLGIRVRNNGSNVLLDELVAYRIYTFLRAKPLSHPKKKTHGKINNLLLILYSAEYNTILIAPILQKLILTLYLSNLL